MTTGENPFEFVSRLTPFQGAVYSIFPLSFPCPTLAKLADNDARTVPTSQIILQAIVFIQFIFFVVYLPILKFGSRQTKSISK